MKLSIVLSPQGHGPFSHVFDGRFIPAVIGPDKWKVSLFMTVRCVTEAWMHSVPTCIGL